MVIQAISTFTRKYPVIRGMVTYTILWPCSNLCQQLLQHRPEIDFKEVARFSLFGGLYVAPTIYIWVRFIGKVMPGNTIKSAVQKALIEQISYAPFGISSFYLGMSWLEGKNWEQMKEEWQHKFLPTYRTGFCVWPLVQTFNFAFVKERNRVAVTGTVSFFWTVFLSYMKQRELKQRRPSKDVGSTS